jgi:hypothetical protein
MNCGLKWQNYRRLNSCRSASPQVRCKICTNICVRSKFHIYLKLFQHSVQWRCPKSTIFAPDHPSIPGSPPFSEDEIQGLFQDFQGPFSVYSRTFFSIFKDLATGKIFENHLTFILQLKERNAIRKKMTSEKMKLEKINIWAIILGLVIILQLFPAY